MISTFVSLAAILAGAPLSVAPAPVATPVAPVAAPVVATAPVPTPPAPAPAALVPPIEAPAIEAPEMSAPAPRPLPVQAEAPIRPEPIVPILQARAPQADTPSDGAAQAAPEDATAPIADPTYVSPTERRAILKAAAGALGAVETAKGRFIQIDPTGQRAVGSFALQRPGRMRFDYDAPVPILIAADGATVAVRDDELETVDRVPLAATPLNLLLDDQLDFETEAEVMRVTKANGQVAITMRDRTGEADGELTLYLDSASYDLMGWRTLDGNDRLTFVELRDVDTGVKLNPRLFIIDDFEDEEEDDRR